jgi:hypothetical protein
MIKIIASYGDDKHNNLVIVICKHNNLVIVTWLYSLMVFWSSSSAKVFFVLDTCSCL